MGFLRVLRGIDSEVEDSFTAILQYSGAQKDLLVTVKTNVVSPLKDQLKYFARGTKGSYVKVRSSRNRNCSGFSALWRFVLLDLHGAETKL